MVTSSTAAQDSLSSRLEERERSAAAAISKRDEQVRKFRSSCSTPYQLDSCQILSSLLLTLSRMSCFEIFDDSSKPLSYMKSLKLKTARGDNSIRISHIQSINLI